MSRLNLARQTGFAPINLREFYPRTRRPRGILRRAVPRFRQHQFASIS